MAESQRLGVEACIAGILNYALLRRIIGLQNSTATNAERAELEDALQDFARYLHKRQGHDRLLVVVRDMRSLLNNDVDIV